VLKWFFFYFFDIIKQKKDRKMRKIGLITLFLTGLFASSNCAMCHTSTYYPLDKYTPEELESILLNFKKAPYGTMGAIARQLTEEQIKEVSKKYGRK
jgi:hypothetical protein